MEQKDSRYEEAKEMIDNLKEMGYPNFDYDNPFYGDNRDMRLSELRELYEKQREKEEPER